MWSLGTLAHPLGNPKNPINPKRNAEAVMAADLSGINPGCTLLWQPKVAVSDKVSVTMSSRVWEHFKKGEKKTVGCPDCNSLAYHDGTTSMTFSLPSRHNNAQSATKISKFSIFFKKNKQH